MSYKRQVAVLFFVLLAIAITAPVAAANANTLSDSSEPGSVLVFPLFKTGTVTTPDQGTLPITSFEISVICPNGATCTDGQDVDIHAEWVCSGEPCSARDFNLTSTINGTVLFNPNSSVCAPGPSFQEPEGCGTVSRPPCAEGFLVVWVVNESGAPIKFDGLVGDAVLRESSGAATAYNAIPIQAAAALANGALVPPGPSGALEFNGTSYQKPTGKIIGSVRYDVINAAGIDQDRTSLILLTLDTLANRDNFPVDVDLVFSNEVQQQNSASTEFVCFEEQSLSDLGFDNSFGTKGLVESISATKTAILGISDTPGPVTLLGLIITREFDAGGMTLLRHYVYPFFNNSIPVATAFKP